MGRQFTQEVALAARMNGSVGDGSLKELVPVGSVGDRGKPSAPKLQKHKVLPLASRGQAGLEVKRIVESEIE